MLGCLAPQGRAGLFLCKYSKMLVGLCCHHKSGLPLLPSAQCSCSGSAPCICTDNAAAAALRGWHDWPPRRAGPSRRVQEWCHAALWQL